MNQRTLFQKLLLLFMGFGLLMTLVFVFVMQVSHETYHREFDQTVNKGLAQQYVAANLLIREPPLTAHNYAKALRHITDINPEIDVYVVDARGDILASSRPNLTLARQRIDLAPVRRFIQSSAALPILGEDPAVTDRRGVFSAAPLSIPNCSAAYLYIMLHGNQHNVGAEQLKTTYAINEGVGVVVAAGIFGVLAALVFLRLLTRRLGELQTDLTRFRDSEFADVPVVGDAGVGRGDEVERLRTSFVELANRVRTQMQELQLTDKNRRDLIASLSHDLKTPLTTLQAHLETLSMKDDLNTAERRSYQTVALQQAQRLSRLVGQLLDLGKIDAGQVTLVAEPFQLADLAHEVASKFRLAARKDNIALIVECPESPPLVVADIALIERVLDNLVANALQHTPRGGQIALRLQVRPESIRVDVRDSGRGIAEADRSKIFERFFRGDRSRSSSSGHAGLGLSIVQGILALHGQSIASRNSQSGGAVFEFELPLIRPSSEGVASGLVRDAS